MSDRGTGRAAQLLGRRLGLRLDGSSYARLTRILLREAARAGCSVDDYVAGLERDAAAFHALVDRVTVQETAFFRHEDQLDALADSLAERPPGVIWSAGCANGQEAWSVAMLLAERRLDGWSVLATDVSLGAIERARAGRYGERELRGLADARRARFMAEAGDGWEVVPELRGRVRFAHHNLVAEDPPAAADGRAVLLRNVLIYLQRAKAARLLGRLREWMPPDGVLVLGAAEALPPDHPAFRPERRGGVFVWRPRADAPASPPRRLRASPEGARVARPRRRPPAQLPVGRGPTHAAIPLPAAREIVAAGEAHAAAGRPLEAAAAFRKAAYLHPDDALAHVRLGLALEAAGDDVGARRAFRAGRLALRRGDPEALAGELGGWSIAELERLLDGRLEWSSDEIRRGGERSETG